MKHDSKWPGLLTMKSKHNTWIVSKHSKSLSWFLSEKEFNSRILPGLRKCSRRILNKGKRYPSTTPEVGRQATKYRSPVVFVSPLCPTLCRELNSPQSVGSPHSYTHTPARSGLWCLCFQFSPSSHSFPLQPFNTFSSRLDLRKS